MSFLWTSSLLLTGLIPLFIGFYVWMLRRRKPFAVRYSSVSLLKEAAGRQLRWRRHIPFALFLLALMSLIIAMSRPVATVDVPSNKATIIMAIDVSPSMCSNDIKPNRLAAAKSAAEAFVRSQVVNRQIGIVAFAGFAELIQPPTDNVQSLIHAIESLVVARRTAVGSAILRGLDAISEVDGRVAPSDLNGAASTLKPAAARVPHIIVILTDGASNAGPPPLEAAQEAVERGVRVYTIGFGSQGSNAVMDCGDQSDQNTWFGGMGLGPVNSIGQNRAQLEVDETTLKKIADSTGGTYYAASSASDLESVFQNLPTFVMTRHETMEISVFFTAFAALSMSFALWLAWRWHPLS